MITDRGTDTPSKGEISSLDGTHVLEFQFNPTTISEKRSVLHHFSQAQGQVLPLAQFGMVEPTEISFELFMFNHNGLEKQLHSLRKLTLPKSINKPEYYGQVSPHKYMLNLMDYGVFIGVVNSVDLTVEQYAKQDMTPIHLRASITFTVISQSLVDDVINLNLISGQ
jgi:autonomous glycyl radical cofactor GrcA